MNFIKKLNYLFDHIGYEKLFITCFPMLVAFSCAFEMFKVNPVNGINIILSIIFLHFSICIFDDFMDWILGYTNKRHELEQLGIRGNYLKCSHFYYDKKNPRKYLLLSFLFFCLFSTLYLKIVISIQKYMLLLFFPLLLFTGFVIYSNFGKRFTKYLGYEICLSILMVSSMISVFYVMTSHVTVKLFCIILIYFFLVLNIIYTSSLLNYKQDKMIGKHTFTTIFDASNIKIYFSLFLTVIPYLLTLLAILLNIFSDIYYIVFLVLPFSLWHFYIMYLFEKVPQNGIKWHALMGIDNNKLENEQKNLSWYYVRCNFLRNIFIILSILFMFCFINFNLLFAF